MRIVLPIHYETIYKTKKNKTEMIGLNGYRNWHYQKSNKIKKYFHKLVKEKLKNEDAISDKYMIEYKLYPKNKRSDMMNVISIIDKFLNDALQELAIVTEDNINYYVKCICEIVEVDKENPRIECIIKEVEE